MGLNPDKHCRWTFMAKHNDAVGLCAAIDLCFSEKFQNLTPSYPAPLSLPNTPKSNHHPRGI